MKINLLYEARVEDAISEKPQPSRSRSNKCIIEHSMFSWFIFSENRFCTIYSLLSREKRIYFFFLANTMRSRLRLAGIRQDRDVYVDVHRGFVPA